MIRFMGTDWWAQTEQPLSIKHDKTTGRAVIQLDPSTREPCPHCRQHMISGVTLYGSFPYIHRSPLLEVQVNGTPLLRYGGYPVLTAEYHPFGCMDPTSAFFGRTGW
jgi:hypothetical protein